MTPKDPRLLRFWANVPDAAAAKLDQADRDALDAAVLGVYGKGSGADIRLSGLGFYLRILAGKERRNKDRLKRERAENPLLTVKNIPVILIAVILSAMATYGVVALFELAAKLLEIPA